MWLCADHNGDRCCHAVMYSDVMCVSWFWGHYLPWSSWQSGCVESAAPQHVGKLGQSLCGSAGTLPCCGWSSQTSAHTHHTASLTTLRTTSHIFFLISATASAGSLTLDPESCIRNKEKPSAVRTHVKDHLINLKGFFNTVAWQILLRSSLIACCSWKLWRVRFLCQATVFKIKNELSVLNERWRFSFSM